MPSPLASRAEPVLIGPAFVGKTTVGACLAERLQVGFVDLDDVGDVYYRAAGMPLSEFEAQVRQVGYANAHRWWQAARVAGVAGVLADYPGSVIALGAGHTHYDDDLYFDMIRDLLAPFVDVVFLLPSEDVDESVEVLRGRSLLAAGHGWDRDGRDWLREWLASSQNAALATRTVYTAGRSPEETAAEIALTLTA